MDAAVGKPRVTVAVPAWNGAAYIEQAVSSVLAQTFDDFELVVIDDCSDDDTVAIVSRFEDSRIRIEANASRLGLVGNWNRCLEAASGEYVSLFHQDDVMMPDNLARKVSVLDEHSSVAFVYSDVTQIDPAGEVLAESWYVPPEPGDAGVHAGLTFLERLFTGENLVCCPTVVMRRGMMRDGGFDSHLPFTADWEMWMRLCLFHDVACVPDRLVHYRRHATAETERFSGVRGLEQCFMAKHRILEKYGALVPVDQWRQRLMTQYLEQIARSVGDAVVAGRLADAPEFLALARRLRLQAALGEQLEIEWTANLLADTVARASRRWVETGGVAEEELSLLRDQVRELRGTVQALRGSASWRLTAPLRFLFRALTGRSA
jgi:hypothetical protein